jgi:beta-galactosidase/beta-glucuronidase
MSTIFTRKVGFLINFSWVVLAGMSGTSANPDRLEKISLNGVWDFHPDGGTDRHDIRVPSFWDAPQDYGYPADWLHMRHGVYKKRFEVPQSMRDKEIFLGIDRVSVIAKVFVNGTQVGAEDSNGYLMMQLPYLINITPHLKSEGENHLEVQVWGGKSIVHGSDSQDTLMQEDDFPPDTKIEGRFLYPYCVDHWDGRRGLNGDVFLVAKPKVHVSDVFVIPNLHKNADPQDDEIMIRLTLANHDAKSRKIRVLNRATRTEGNKAGREFEPFTVTLPANSTMDVNVQNAAWPDADYWWPHHPALYLLETTLIETNEPVATETTRFGFREFYVKGDHYQLNGIRANLRGDTYEYSWHEGYRHGPSTGPVLSTKELIPKMQEHLVHEYAKLNHNVLRPHKASAYAGLYDLCDEIGMMVLDEAPFWETWVRTDERSKPYYEAWVHRWIKARRNHPSIVAWIGANECWYGATGVIATQAIRTMDTSRPSFHEDPWGPVSHDDIHEPFEGDEDCRHYTGGYPMKALNTESLYDVYRTNPPQTHRRGRVAVSRRIPAHEPGRHPGDEDEPGRLHRTQNQRTRRIRESGHDLAGPVAPRRLPNVPRHALRRPLGRPPLRQLDVCLRSHRGGYPPRME